MKLTKTFFFLCCIGLAAGCSERNRSTEPQVELVPAEKEPTSSKTTIRLKKEKTPLSKKLVIKKAIPKKTVVTKTNSNTNRRTIFSDYRIAVDLPYSKSVNSGFDYGSQGPIVITITGPVALKGDYSGRVSDIHPKPNSFYIRGREFNIVSLYKYLLMYGVSNPNFQDLQNRTVSTMAIEIRCDKNQAFAYVRSILSICTNPNVSIYKINLAVGGTIVRGSQPTLVDSSLPIVSDHPKDGPRRTSLTVQIRKVLGSRIGRTLIDQDTVFYVGDRKIAGSNFEKIRTKILGHLKRTRKARPNAIGRIDVAQGVSFEDVMTIHDLFIEAKFKTIRYVPKQLNRTLSALRTWMREMKPEVLKVSQFGK